MDGDGAQKRKERYGERQEDEGGGCAGAFESDEGQQREAKADASSCIRNADATSFGKRAAGWWARLRRPVTRCKWPAQNSGTKATRVCEDGELSTAFPPSTANVEESGEQPGQDEDVARGEAEEDEEYDRYDVSVIDHLTALIARCLGGWVAGWLVGGVWRFE